MRKIKLIILAFLIVAPFNLSAQDDVPPLVTEEMFTVVRDHWASCGVFFDIAYIWQERSAMQATEEMLIGIVDYEIDGRRYKTAITDMEGEKVLQLGDIPRGAKIFVRGSYNPILMAEKFHMSPIIVAKEIYVMPEYYTKSMKTLIPAETINWTE